MRKLQSAFKRWVDFLLALDLAHHTNQQGQHWLSILGEAEQLKTKQNKKENQFLKAKFLMEDAYMYSLIQNEFRF